MKSKLPEGWKEVELKKVIDVQIDNRGRNPSTYLEYSIYPVIDNYLIKNQRYPDMSNINRYIDEETFNNFLRGYVEKDDVIITLVGNGIGNVSMVPNSNAVIIQNTLGLRCNNSMNNIFLYYSLLYNQNDIKNFDRGTSQPSIRKTDLFKYNILMPPIKEQKVIADTLLALDDKIELNNKINENLEEQAQAIFKHWFIDFEFPDENGNPYKSSGGQMVESELGMIPKEWEVTSIDEIIELHDSKRIPLSKRDRDDMDKVYPYYGATSIIDYVDDYIFDGTYLLLGEDGSVSDDLGYPILQYVWGKIWVNNHAHVITGKAYITVEYLYMLFKNTNVNNIITGAVQKKINQGNLKSLKIINPSKVITLEYIKMIDIIFEKRKTLKIQNQVLEELRDTILPRLMSGELRIPF